MPVDTRDKRFSMMGLLQPVPSILPNPDGTIETQDRAQYAFMYHGIALVEPRFWDEVTNTALTWTDTTDNTSTWTPTTDNPTTWTEQ